MLSSIDLFDLEQVSGGQNTTVVKDANGGEKSTNRTDYAYCADTVAQACRAANPGTLWGTNEAKAAQCQIQNLPAACGKPPTKE
jgi:hypothetical protein